MRDLVNGGLPFRSREGPQLGFSSSSLSRAVRGGILRRPLRGVVVDARVVDDRDLRIGCLRLVIPAHGVVWGRTAAWLYGIDSFAPGEQDLLTPECAVPNHRGRCTHPGVRGVEATLPEESYVVVDGVAVTTERRTAMDLGRHLSRPMALAALDAFTHAGLVTVIELREDLADLVHHPGVVQARELVALVEPRTESPGESWLRLRVVDAGFPRPEAQIEVCDSRGRVRFRLDLGFRDRRLGLEYDGADYHDSLAQQRDDDRRRGLLKRQHDWDVYGFGRESVLGRRPTVELVVGELLGMEPRLPRRW